MKQVFFIITFLFLSVSILCSQEIYQWEDTIKAVSEEIMMSDEWTARAASLKRMPDILSRALDQDGSFGLSFDSSRISVIYAPDSSFRIMTGQAVLEGDEIKYYGLLQKRDDERHPVFFQDNSYAPNELGQEILSTDTWNGAVYYNLIPFQMEEKQYYLIFGFAAKSLFENSKVAEVVYFDNGELKFGAPVFFDGDDQVKNRISMVYSADVGARLNYDTAMQMIIFDNLIPMQSPYKERKVLMVPDGSYRGYSWDKEHHGWVYVDKLYTEILTEAPRDKPVLDDQKGKDLFGRNKEE